MSTVKVLVSKRNNTTSEKRTMNTKVNSKRKMHRLRKKRVYTILRAQRRGTNKRKREDETRSLIKTKRTKRKTVAKKSDSKQLEVEGSLLTKRNEDKIKSKVPPCRKIPDLKAKLSEVGTEIKEVLKEEKRKNKEWVSNCKKEVKNLEIWMTDLKQVIKEKVKLERKNKKCSRKPQPTELQASPKTKLHLELEVGKIYKSLNNHLKKLEIESSLLRTLRTKKVLAEARVRGQVASVWGSDSETKVQEIEEIAAKTTANTKLEDLTDRLEAVWKAVNDEKNALKEEMLIANWVAFESDPKVEKLRREKEIVEKKLIALGEKHKQVIQEKNDLEYEVTNMSAQLAKVEFLRNMMGKTLKNYSNPKDGKEPLFSRVANTLSPLLLKL